MVRMIDSGIARALKTNMNIVLNTMGRIRKNKTMNTICILSPGFLLIMAC